MDKHLVTQRDSVVNRDQAFVLAKRWAVEKHLGHEDIWVLLREHGLTKLDAKTAVFGKKHVGRLLARELLRRRA